VCSLLHNLSCAFAGRIGEIMAITQILCDPDQVATKAEHPGALAKNSSDPERIASRQVSGLWQSGFKKTNLFIYLPQKFG
jgi:hypothetical protein